MRKARAFLFAAILTTTAGGWFDPAAAARLGYSRAYCLSETISPREAISACTAVLQKFRKHTDALVRRGAAFSELGQFDYAIGDFSRAIKFDPKKASAFYRRGLAFESRGRLRESLADFRRALELKPGDEAAAEALWRATTALAALARSEAPAPAPEERRAENAPPAPAPPRQAATAEPEEPGGEEDALFLLIPALLSMASVAVVIFLCLGGARRGAREARKPLSLSQSRSR